MKDHHHVSFLRPRETLRLAGNGSLRFSANWPPRGVTTTLRV